MSEKLTEMEARAFSAMEPERRYSASELSRLSGYRGMIAREQGVRLGNNLVRKAGIKKTGNRYDWHFTRPAKEPHHDR